MSSDSMLKNIFTSFFKSLFGVIGLGIGIILLFLSLSVIFATPNTIPHATSVRVLPDNEWKTRSFSHDKATILKINIDGVIGLDHLTKDAVFQQLLESQDAELKQGQVKGIIMHINSPGGVADEADATYRLFLEYKERFKVPVIAYVEGMCASGGMLIACAADKIYATEDSLVGHVGVLLSPPFFNFSKLMDKLGVESKTFYAGKDKDNMNPFRPWRPEEGLTFQNIVNAMYDRFTSIVAKHRPKLTKESLIEQGAQIYPAYEAESLGYIDERVHSIDDVLKSFATELGIQEDYQFVQLERQNFFEELFGGQMAALLDHKFEHRLRVPGDLHPDLHGKPLYLFHP